MYDKQNEIFQHAHTQNGKTNQEGRRPSKSGSVSENGGKKKNLPRPKLKLSIGTLVEIERWAESVRYGEARYAFRPVLRQMRRNGDHLDDVIHGVTLAQIMPYKEIKNHLQIYYLAQAIDLWDCVDTLSHKYQTSRQNVIERLYHVGRLASFLKKQKKIEEEADV